MTSHEELMRFLDGEAAPEERVQVEHRLESSSELRREFAVYKAMKQGLRDLSFAPQVVDSSWDRIRARITAPVGWLLGGSGLVAWAGYGLWVFFTSPASTVVRIASGGVVIGILVLLAHVIWDRCREYRSDPYRHVQR